MGTPTHGNLNYLRRLKRGLHVSMRNNGQAYGFSVSVTAGLAMLQQEQQDIDAVRILLFALGAAAAFSALEGALSGGYRKSMENEPSTVAALGISLSFFSVGTTTAVAWGTASAASGMFAWPLTGFVISTVFPVLAGVEMAIAREVRDVLHMDQRREDRDTEEIGEAGESGDE